MLYVILCGTSTLNFVMGFCSFTICRSKEEPAGWDSFTALYVVVVFGGPAVQILQCMLKLVLKQMWDRAGSVPLDI